MCVCPIFSTFLFEIFHLKNLTNNTNFILISTRLVLNVLYIIYLTTIIGLEGKYFLYGQNN